MSSMAVILDRASRLPRSPRFELTCLAARSTDFLKPWNSMIVLSISDLGASTSSTPLPV